MEVREASRYMWVVEIWLIGESKQNARLQGQPQLAARLCVVGRARIGRE
jgi:hypothetical protein